MRSQSRAVASPHVAAEAILTQAGTKAKI